MKAYRNDIQNLTVLCFNFSFPKNKIFCFDAMSGTKVELMIIQKKIKHSATSSHEHIKLVTGKNGTNPI